MSSGSVVFVAALAIVAAVAGWLVWRRVSGLALDAEREAVRLAGGAATVRVDRRAQFVGLASAGRGVRGSGTLLLSERDLIWVMGTPRRTLTVPRASIDGASSASELLGMSAGRPLLQVDHRGPTGEADVAAWVVDDLDAWIAAIAAPVEAP